MEKHIKAILKIIIDMAMAMAFRNGEMVKNIMDNSIKILCKEVVIVNGLMGPLIKELGAANVIAADKEA